MTGDELKELCFELSKHTKDLPLRLVYKLEQVRADDFQLEGFALTEGEEQIMKQIRKDMEYEMGDDTYLFCGKCGGMQLTESHYHDGRNCTEIDNWEPSYYEYFCEQCGSEI